MCYTNHALDQLLEHLLDDNIKNMIRMGSRSKSERLENINIRAVSEQMPLTKTESRQTYELGRRMRDLESDVTRLLDELSRSKSCSATKAYLATFYPAHHRELFGNDGDNGDRGWKKVQHSRLDVIQRWLAKANPLVPDNPGASQPIETLQSMSLACMTQSERQKLHQFWLKEIRDTIIADLNRTLKDHEQTRDQRHRVRQDVRRRCLQQADIVGVTTTGLARELPLLRKLRTKVMLCEEAGEVLEAHILTAMLPSVEQVILIGDHLQLRPQIQNYQLQSTNPKGRQYSLDMSLFERLVQPPLSSDARLPVTVLETQRRMHPSIADMVRSTVYNTLKDSTNVIEYPEVVGMRRRLFWLHHEALEAGAAAQDPHNTSHSNDYEVEMTACLVSHLVRQGKYSPEDIAVLTPYLGQLQKLNRRMAAESTFAVSLDDRDLDDLEDLNATQSEKLPPPQNQTVAKTTLARSVRLATVDNFQGEEAKVVIISLVRSNPQKRCGFLSTSNRINVLLSRAKHGCYIIGNSISYSNVQMWKEIIQLLQSNDSFGEKLELQCPRHPDTSILVSQPEHFSQLSPDAGCTLRCDRRLECGHACHGPCHSDLVHKAVKCIEDCPRPKQGCDHACPLQCGDRCEDECNVILKGINLKLPCGHVVQTARCWQAQNPAAIDCQEMVEREVPACSHTVTLDCSIEVNSSSFQCVAECGQILPCGHTCHSACHRCNIRVQGQLATTNHGICQQVCGRNYTTCPHTCQQACHGEAQCGPCIRPCEVHCSHSRCSKLCHEPCAPCAEQDCASSCPHGKCTMPCAAPCDWVPCSKRCALVLSCGHQCPSLCGESCPGSKYCQACGSEDILSTVVDFLEMKEYKEVDVDEAPCIFPDCGHFFTVESMDGQMSMREHYELDENDIPTGIKTAADSFSMDEIKTCSVCRSSLRNIARYGRIVRRAMLDQATKKFISWSAIRHLQLADHLMTEQQKLDQSEETQQDVSRPGRLTLTGDVVTQINNLRKWVGHKRYNGLAQVYTDISRFVDQVSVQAQPFHRVFEFVRHAKRQNRTENSFDYEGHIIQLRGYLLALSLLLKCNITLLSDFMSLWKASGIKRTILSVDLATSFAQCEKLIKLATDTSRPHLQAEGHIYFAQLCGFSLPFCSSGDSPEASMPGAFPEATAATVTITDPERGSNHESLKEKGLGHLERARNLLENAVWDSRSLMEAEIEAADIVLNGGVFYRPVTTDEMRAVYAAMAREFHGTGHWYTCEQGHPFTVGECGMPMEQARCPECGSAVGGQNHAPAEGVRHADEIEELSSNLGRMRV